MNIYDIETPAVLIDVDALDHNLRNMAGYCKTPNLALRPHTKTHKIPEIARLQMRYGATGITVAKLAEAEVMADAGMPDVTFVYPLWGESKWKRLAELAKRVISLSRWIRWQWPRAFLRRRKMQVLKLEFDWNSTPAGTLWPSLNGQAIGVAQRIFALSNLRWEGISVYPVHIMGNRKTREQDIVVENVRLDIFFRGWIRSAFPIP